MNVRFAKGIFEALLGSGSNSCFRRSLPKRLLPNQNLRRAANQYQKQQAEDQKKGEQEKPMVVAPTLPLQGTALPPLKVKTPWFVVLNPNFRVRPPLTPF